MLNLPTTQRAPLNIAFLTPDLGLGGAERWILSLAANLVAARPVGLAIAKNQWVDGELLAEARRIMPVRRAAGNDLASARQALARAARRAHVVLSWGLDLAGLIDDLPIPVVDVMHCAADLGPDFAALAERGCRQAHYVAAVTEAALSCVPEDKRAGVAILHNGADPARVAPRLGRRVTRDNWRIGDHERVALFVGRFAESKNPQALVQALTHLPAHWRAIFIGADVGAGRQLKLEADRYAPGRVYFTPPRAHLGDMYAAADVLCLPSRSEGHSLVVNEAWLAGLPVVTCRYQAMLEFERLHGAMCWLTSVQPTGEELAEALEQAAAAGRDHRRVEHARRVAFERYTAPAMAARWEAWLLDHVLPDWYSHALYPPLTMYRRE